MMTSREESANLEMLESAAEQLGLDLLGTARLTPEIRETFHTQIRGAAAPLENAVAIGVRLSEPVLQTVLTAPTWTYYYHYRMVNYSLDQAGVYISGQCARRGYRALPVPASQIMDWSMLRGHLSHREIGEMAGLGWRGRNNLLVNPQYGSQVRYATVLTDMPLPAGKAEPAQAMGAYLYPEGCGECTRCIDACPVGAIHMNPEDFELDRCAAQLRRFSKSEKLNTMICGLCVRVCGGEMDSYNQKVSQ